MSSINLLEVCKSIKNIVESLEAKECVYFENLHEDTLVEGLPVVYVIFNKNNYEALYVGRTTDLRGRLYTNHLMGNKSTARLKKYIVEDNINFSNIKKYSEAKKWIKENCCFKYIEVKDSNDRGHIEGLLGFVLNSRYIESEHIKKR